MKKTANFSLFTTILFCCGFVLNAQAQDYATTASLNEKKTLATVKSKTFVAPVMTPVSFSGGTAAWNQYLMENLIYPLKARENAIEGKVVVSFWVNPTGEVKGIKIEQSLGYGCDEEVKRLIGQSPRWNPALQGTIPVKTRMIVPVQFKLTN
jgi:protein TonB